MEPRRQHGVYEQYPAEDRDDNGDAGARECELERKCGCRKRNEHGVGPALCSPLLGRQRMEPLGKRRAAVHGPEDQSAGNHEKESRDQSYHCFHGQSVHPTNQNAPVGSLLDQAE